MDDLKATLIEYRNIEHPEDKQKILESVLERINRLEGYFHQMRLALELSQYAQLQAEQEVELQKKLHEVCITEKCSEVSKLREALKAYEEWEAFVCKDCLDCLSKGRQD